MPEGSLTTVYLDIVADNSIPTDIVADIMSILSRSREYPYANIKFCTIEFQPPN